jgi:ATP-dependent Zn protease
MIGQPQLHTLRTAAIFPDINERVLYHELGHLIVGLTLGHVPESITVTPVEIGDRWLNGRVTWKSRPADQPFNFEQRFNRIKVIAGGPAAERLFAGEYRGLRGGDEANARMHARTICSTEKGIGHLIQAAMHEAENILIERSHVVLALADTLRASGTMTADEIAAAVSNIEAAKMAASWKKSGRLGGDTVADIRMRMQLRQSMIDRYATD